MLVTVLRSTLSLRSDSLQVLIIESCEKKNIDKSSSIVHVRNSLLIKEKLGFDFISHESEIKNVISNKYDVIICAYSSPYMRYKQYIDVLLANPNAKIIWLVNDHDVEDNILLRNWVKITNNQFHMICNNPRSGYRHWILNKNINEKKLNDWINEWHTINLNCLIFEESKYDETKNFHDKEGIVYYGTHRKHRIFDMIRYNGAGYALSSSKKNHEKFKNSGIEAQFIEKMLWEEKDSDMFEPVGLRLKDYLITLYFEDNHTHTNYAFMANRFYESLMCNTLIIYDESCNETIKKSGFNIHPMQIVQNSKELINISEQLSSDKNMYQMFLKIQQSNVIKVLKEQEIAYNQIFNVCKN